MIQLKLETYNKICENLVTQKEELRATKHALWMARAMRAKEKIAWFKLWNCSISTMNPEDGARKEYECWQWVERKCLEKAKEYEG